MYNLIKVLIILLPISVFGQINFYNQFSNNGVDLGEGVVQLEDSSYVICGSSSSFQNGASQAFLLKVDSTGNKIWSNNYGGFESESARRVLYKKDYGFLMAGFTNSMGAGSYDYYLAKVDEAGSLEWEKTYGGIGWDRVRDAVMSRDTGAVMVGQIETPGSGLDWYIVKTDSNGDTLWTKTFGGTGDDIANCISVYNDSLYIIGGNGYVEDSLKTKAIFMYMKEDGSVLDIDTIGNNGNYYVNDITISNDSIQAVGDFKLNQSDNFAAFVYILKMSPTSLTFHGGYSLAPDGDYYGHLITNYGNGTRLYVNFGIENAPLVFTPGEDMAVHQFTSGFAYVTEIAWLNEVYPDIGGQMIPTSDGGAVLVGYRGGIGPGQGSVFILKIGPDESVPTIGGVVFVSDLVGLDEADQIEGLKIYPNPAGDYLNIELPETDNFDVNIFDILGNVVMSRTMQGVEQLDVSHLSGGTYTIQIIKDGGLVGMQKLIIE